MKNHMIKVLIGLVFMMSCSRVNEDPEFSSDLEQRGNDNHKIWNLAQVDRDYSFTLTDGSQGVGKRLIKYEYSCIRPFGRAVTFSDIDEENGEELWHNSSTMSYNDNFMISEEHAQEYGEEVVRNYQYDSDYKWTGIITKINGEVVDDTLEIGPGGQVKSYTSNGVRYEYTWKANNAITMKIYIQPSSDLRTINNSLVFNHVGLNENSRKATKALILKSFNDLQQARKTSSSYRSKNADEWVLIGIEEDRYDPKVIEPFSSPAKGFPGTSSDGGYYYLSKNFVVSYKAFRVNPDGTPIQEYYSFNCNSYSVKDNLPVDAHYTYDIPEYAADEEGNSIDYHEQGTIHYKYISGCNQKTN